MAQNIQESMQKEEKYPKEWVWKKQPTSILMVIVISFTCYRQHFFFFDCFYTFVCLNKYVFVTKCDDP